MVSTHGCVQTPSGKALGSPEVGTLVLRAALHSANLLGPQTPAHPPKAEAGPGWELMLVYHTVCGNAPRGPVKSTDPHFPDEEADSQRG